MSAATPVGNPDDVPEQLQVRVVRLSQLGSQRSAIPAQEFQAAPVPPSVEARVASLPERRTAARSHSAADKAEERASTRPPQPISASSAPAREVAPPRRLITAGRVFFLIVVALLYVGYHVPTERYITPKRGLGYTLGIIGGSLMLLLLVYSLRKRYSWLKFLGSTPSWFRFHMVLGVLGPLCILYHSNFTTGATNSNVALFAMLTVAGSGLIGRYIYAHIHHGLYGSKLELNELRGGAEELRSTTSRVGFLPDLVQRLEASERRLLSTGPRLPLLAPVKLPMVALTALALRWRLHRYVHRSLRALARQSAVIAAERRRMSASACGYVDRRIAATRRVAGFESYERLFSMWHALHIPLIFMMIIAAVIHVIAVHVY
ncbi:MAG: pyridine nucleotide-disulfide oxidoreductase [Proteobacteria bacterium]|nr:pyridine nucleotide-disulfide oxidoreductase [Pseudomonadota bacterium]